jgi:hypothetical protein
MKVLRLIGLVLVLACLVLVPSVGTASAQGMPNGFVNGIANGMGNGWSDGASQGMPTGHQAGATKAEAALIRSAD